MISSPVPPSEVSTAVFVAHQGAITLTALAIGYVAFGLFSVQASIAFAVPFAITGAIAIGIGAQFYKDEDNHRYSIGQQILAGVSWAVHFVAFCVTGSIVPVISGSLLTIYFIAAYFIDRDKVYI